MKKISIKVKILITLAILCFIAPMWLFGFSIIRERGIIGCFEPMALYFNIPARTILVIILVVILIIALIFRKKVLIPLLKQKGNSEEGE